MPGVSMSTATDKTHAATPLAQRPVDKIDENVEMEDAEHELDESNDTKPKKKRRVVKTSDKKYDCPQPDCTKAYSRAEHLYRHQLNHTPKQIYHCDFPGCDRHFVRADLCARHKERHTAKGSHLQRKDAFMNSQRTVAPSNGHSSESGTTTANDASPADSAHAQQSKPSEPYARPPAQAVQPYATPAEQYADPPIMAELPLQQTGGATNMNPHLVYSAASTYPTAYTGPGAMAPPESPNASRSYSLDGQYSRPTGLANGYAQPLPMHPPPLSSPPTSTPMYAQQTYPSPASTGQNFRSPTNGNYPSLPPLPPFGLPPSYDRSGNAMSPSVGSINQYPMPNSRAGSVIDFNVMDQFAAGYAMPVFGTDAYNRSPQSMLDDALFQQLLEQTGMDLSGAPSPPFDSSYRHSSHISTAPLPKDVPDGATTEQTAGADEWDSSSPIINGMDLSMRESDVSERKQGRIIALVNSFEDVKNLPGRKLKKDIVSGDTTDPDHPLSVNMLKTYITSYWIHIHQQMPIMHRPTFSAETCPDLLLLAMFCLGACCLERTHHAELIRDCAELAFYSAHHIRWEVFKDAEFRPTAKLWTFQTMLLLELFEKMYSTRPLHERAHIHHATTLTVMRRGSSLIGRSALDTQQDSADPTRTPPGPDGSINTSGQNTPDAWWNRWITAEATKRVAFAAFVIDSTHATLFGHSAVMSAHDLKVPLPCDEALWSATSSAEVQRVEASLAANGFKPTMFLEGLKKTLNGQKVRTNVFGRVILMAGLLNLSYHMNQRELQVSSVGAANTLGNATRWRTSLSRAFDFWRRDFDDSLSKNDHWLQVSNPENKSRCHQDHRDNVFESRTCLHSLAHMAMHVDIVDCEVFAGSRFALGRVVTDADRAAVQQRMYAWAPSARARDATFYALRFICEVLVTDEDASVKTRPGNPQTLVFRYSARDDYLLNRPWILYFATMIIWAYGYALEGAIRPSNYTLTTREQQIHDMQGYLHRIGGVASPDDLETLKDRNSCVGLLMLLRDCFRQPRWELLHESSDMLQLCIELLSPRNSEAKSAGVD